MNDRDGFGKAIDDELSSLVLTPGAKERIRSAAADGTVLHKKRPIRFRKGAVAALAACLSLVLCVQAAAAAFPSFERFLVRMGDDLRHLVKPVGEEDVRQNIKMEVLAAVNDGESAVVYLSMQDEKVGRIDDGTELLNVHFQAEGGSEHMMSWSQLVDYDAGTGTSIFRLEAEGMDSIHGRQVELKVGSILSGVESYDLATGLTLADAEPAAKYQTVADATKDQQSAEVSVYYGSSPSFAHTLENEYAAGTLPVLLPAEEAQPLESAPWLSLCGLGLAKDTLHLQYAPLANGGLYADHEFYLAWPGGPDEYYESTLANAKISLGDPLEEGARSYYNAYEQVLELPKAVPAEDVSLRVWGSTYSEYIDGGWHVSFALDEDPPELSAACSIDMIGWTAHTVSVSSIGATVYGTGDMNENTLPLTIEVRLKDGSTVESISSFSGGNADGKIIVRDGFSRPLNLDDVETLVVNGQEFRWPETTAQAA